MDVYNYETKRVLIRLSQNRKENINTNLHGRYWRQKTNHHCLQRLQREQSILTYAHFQDLGVDRFLLTLPVEIIEGMLDTLVEDSSNPHILASPEQTKFIVRYNCIHSAN